MRWSRHDDGRLELEVAGRLLLAHTPQAPAVFIGHGRESVAMYRVCHR